jgi:hypothetical protein
VRVKIGMSSVPRELDLEIENGDETIAAFEAAIAESKDVLWITEQDGRRFGLVVDKIVFFEVEPESDKRIGFSR